MKKGDSNYRLHIDGLRGLSIVLVLAFHLFPRAAPNGYVGVDVFFVISGYLVTALLVRDASSPSRGTMGIIWDFYGRRARRLFPSLSVVLAACLVAGYFLLLPSEWVRLAGQTLSSAGFVQNLTLASHSGYFSADARTTPLLHIWSLGVEEQFYVLWPIVVLAAIRFRVPMTGLAVYLGAFSFGWCVLRPGGTDTGAFFLPQMRMWELLMGSAVSALGSVRADDDRAPGSGAGIGDAAVGLGIALILASAYWPSSAISPPSAWTLLPTVGAALVVSSVPRLPGLTQLLSAGPLAWLGRISYPLYLWHWPLYSFAFIATGSEPSTILRILIVASSLALASATHVLIEDPFRRGRKRSLIVGSVLPLAGVVLLAVIVRERNGFAGRYPPFVAGVLTYNYDTAGPTRLGTYFVMGDRDESSFRNDPEELLADKPLVYLWGDSHAASLYAGLRKEYGSRYAVIQRTAAKTPPFMPAAFNPGNAQRISQFVIDSIRQRKPGVVILDADWERYDIKDIGETIRALKQLGVGHVIVVGPVPHWLGSLPQQLFEAVRLHRDQPVPFELDRGYDPETGTVDLALKQLATAEGAEYVDALAVFTGKEGYIIRSGDRPEDLFTFDSSHLTVAGATFLASHVPLP